MFQGRVTFHRLRWVGPLAVLISLAVNLLIRGISFAVFKPSAAFTPLGIGPVCFWSIVLGVGAVLVFGLVGRYARNPGPVFLVIGLLVYLVTFLPDLLIIFVNPPPFHDTTPTAVNTLLVMHAAETSIILCLLLILGFDRNAKMRA
jgi:hypothetical protein